MFQDARTTQHSAHLLHFLERCDRSASVFELLCKVQVFLRQALDLRQGPPTAVTSYTTVAAKILMMQSYTCAYHGLMVRRGVNRLAHDIVSFAKIVELQSPTPHHTASRTTHGASHRISC